MLYSNRLRWHARTCQRTDFKATDYCAVMSDSNISTAQQQSHPHYTITTSLWLISQIHNAFVNYNFLQSIFTLSIWRYGYDLTNNRIWPNDGDFRSAFPVSTAWRQNFCSPFKPISVTPVPGSATSRSSQFYTRSPLRCLSPDFCPTRSRSNVWSSKLKKLDRLLQRDQLC